MKNVKGMTLIELLIAMTILVMLLSVSFYSYNTITMKWKKNRATAE